MIPENDQQYNSDYYAIDIANRPEVISFSHIIRTAVEENNFEDIPTCRPLFRNIFFIEFPSCNPATQKLKPVCEAICPQFFTSLSKCFSDAVQSSIMIADLASLYDAYNCTDPSTYIPNVSGSLYDSQQNCSNNSVFDANVGKYICIYIDIVRYVAMILYK